MTTFDTLISVARRDVTRFCADQSGATAIEYAMIASGVGAFVAGTVFSVGGGVKTFFTTVAGLFP
jgi:pilus assembly protein Flp/PilA